MFRFIKKGLGLLGSKAPNLDWLLAHPPAPRLRQVPRLQLVVEELGQRILMSANDQINEAIGLGAMTQTRTYTGESINPATDVDMFAVSVTAGQRIAIDIDRPSGSLDSWVNLFNASGQRLAYNDDGPNPGEPSSLESFLQHTFNTGGTYYIGVSGFGNANYNPITGNGDTSGSVGPYSLFVSPVSGGTPAGDSDDQINEAISLGAITQVRTRTGESISLATDVDMFSISVTAGQRIAIDIDRPSGAIDSWLRVFNSNGQQLAFNDDGPNPGEPSSLESFLQHTFNTGGTYYIGVSGFGNANYNPITGNGDTSGSVGPYSLFVSPVSAGLDLRLATPIDDYAGHVGADYLAEVGTALLSPVSGRVLHVGPISGYGTMAVAVEVTLSSQRTFASELSGTSVTTNRVIVIFGHLRPSRDLVANPDPLVRFQQGQPELGYQAGSFITAGQRLGYIERPDYADHDSVSHVHVTMSDGVNPPASIWLGRGLSSSDPRRARYIRPELAWDLLT